MGIRDTIRVVRPRPGAVVVELLGEYDLGTRDELRALLVDLVVSHDLVVADLSETTYLDSSGMWTLVEADRFARELGKRFRLQVGTAPIVKKALEYSHLLDRLAWAPTRDEVLRDDQ